MDNRISGRCTNYFDGWSHKLAPNLCTCNYIITLFGSSFKVHHNVITVRKRSLRRLCFYTCLSVILFTGVGVSVKVHAGIHPLGADTPSPWGQTPPGCMPGDTFNKRALRILLECIVVL